MTSDRGGHDRGTASGAEQGADPADPPESGEPPESRHPPEIATALRITRDEDGTVTESES